MKKIKYFFILFLIILTPIINASAEEDITPPDFLEIRVDELTDNSINISWKTTEETTYEIRYGSGEDCDQMVAGADLGTIHQRELTELIPNTHYHFYILAIDANLNEKISRDYYFETLDREHEQTIPNFVGDIIISKQTKNSINVNFKTDIEAITSVEYGQNQSYGNSFEDREYAENHNYLIENLFENTKYHFRISVKNTTGMTISEDLIFFLESDTPIDTTPPNRIIDLSATNINTTDLTLEWTKPGDDSEIMAYEILISNAEITRENFNEAEIVSGSLILVENITEQGGKDTYEITNLVPNTNYHFVIRSSDISGNFSSISNLLSIITDPVDINDNNTQNNTGGNCNAHTSIKIPETTIFETFTFGPARNVRAGALDSEIHIFWENPNSVDFLKTLIIKKENNYPTNQKDGVIIYEGNKETFVDTNVKNEKTYYYKLFSIDKSLNISIPVQFSISPRGGIHRLHFITENKTGMTIKLTKNFKLGDKDHEITHIQELLATDPSIYPEGLTTGYFGLLTKKAVIRFQEKNNLNNTGEIDKETREKLIEILKAQSITSSPFEVGIISFEQNLKFGMKNNNVRYLQEFLIKEGLFPENLVSGVFGPITQKAVISFQQKNSILPATGYVGSITRAKIIESLSK